ncbi:MAG: hypothetical protein PCFJNLEI_00479 [Verrucomicrobiae bacterium]|nr:hypothetical protein [Verrucomicrobiae bacterium]
MNRHPIAPQQPIRSGSACCRSVFLTIVITLISSGAESAGQAKQQPTPELEALNTAAAVALTMEAYRQVQSAMIDAEFQKRVRVTARLEDAGLAADYIRLAAKRRDSRRHKLEAELRNMKATYNTWAGLDSDKSPPRLDMAAATTRLQAVAVSSPTSDLDPRKKLLVKAILRPRFPKTFNSFDTVNVRSSMWFACALTVAQYTEVYHSSLTLLAVLAIIVILRMSQLVALAEGPSRHRFLPSE